VEIRGTGFFMGQMPPIIQPLQEKTAEKTTLCSVNRFPTSDDNVTLLAFAGEQCAPGHPVATAVD